MAEGTLFDSTGLDWLESQPQSAPGLDMEGCRAAVLVAADGRE